MPRLMELRLRARARRLGLKGRRQDAYVYGTLRKTGWKPRRHK
jgi:hypothetical protein